MNGSAQGPQAPTEMIVCAWFSMASVKLRSRVVGPGRTAVPRFCVPLGPAKRDSAYSRRGNPAGYERPAIRLDTDESNPMSRFLLHILAAFAELEREMIRERVRAGLRAARANGKALGRPRRVFRRHEAVRLRSRGASWRKIAQALDLPMSTVIRACSENPCPGSSS